jgi:hypothetical protein
VGLIMLDILNKVPSFTAPPHMQDQNYFIKHLSSENNSANLILLESNGGALRAEMNPIDKSNLEIRIIRESGDDNGLKATLNFLFQPESRTVKNALFSTVLKNGGVEKSVDLNSSDEEVSIKVQAKIHKIERRKKKRKEDNRDASENKSKNDRIAVLVENFLKSGEYLNTDPNYNEWVPELES